LSLVGIAVFENYEFDSGLRGGIDAMPDSDLTVSTRPVLANPRADWPVAMQDELTENAFNGCVGSVLVSETDRVRVWHLSLPAGIRCTFHRHVLDYFWTAHNAGRGRNYFEDGSTSEVDYRKGETTHLNFGKDEYMIHAVENIGETELLFTTVEFLDSANKPLPVPDAIRLKLPS
jgi:beta-alanine degradation protein BauB